MSTATEDVAGTVATQRGTPPATARPAPAILFVPGLRDHVADHWQTLLAARTPGAKTVEPRATDRLSCEARMAALDQALLAIDRPVLLVAHSAGCMTTVRWAARYGARNVVGALLAAPADFGTPMPDGYPDIATLADQGWLPIPRRRLPFRCIVAASSNDPLCTFDRAAGFAADWGATLVELGAVGHLNPASGFGEWPRGRELIDQLATGLR